MRTFVIGDIHGCSKALRAIVDEIAPHSDDTLVFLGDYIDRGPNSRDVIDQVLQLQNTCKVISLRGNHEVMMQGVVMHAMDDATWLANGGNTTVASYGGSIARIPDSHLEFLCNLLPFYESDQSIFVHANYDASLPMIQQHEKLLYWTHLNVTTPGPHQSGKRVYVGHTPQPDGEIGDHGHLICLDTYCFGGGYLTAYQLETSQVLQTDHHGHLRRAPMAVLAHRIKSWKQGCFSFWKKRPNGKRSANSQRREST